MQQKVIVVESRNVTPEEQVNERIKKLGSEWRIVSASTSLQAVVSDKAPVTCNVLHVFYVTTLILEK